MLARRWSGLQQLDLPEENVLTLRLRLIGKPSYMKIPFTVICTYLYFPPFNVPCLHICQYLLSSVSNFPHYKWPTYSRCNNIFVDVINLFVWESVKKKGKKKLKKKGKNYQPTHAVITSLLMWSIFLLENLTSTHPA